MDLRSIINTEAGEGVGQKQAAPVTPIQSRPPHQGFRDYSQPPLASPGALPPRDSGSGHPQASASFASQTPYQGSQGSFSRPPAPPPIQAVPQSVSRSPTGSYSGQSPYQRQSQALGISNTQYPFPHNQAPPSPAQKQHYTQAAVPRDSHPQANGYHLQHNTQTRASPSPQTPPIGIPGAPHPYLQHQRSHSSVSASTPTSAHSQQQFFSQPPQDSPVSTGHYPPPQIPQHQRQQSQQSQPGTPLGPPVNQRQSSTGFNQPVSPYQQRPSNNFPYNQNSPHPPPPATIPRQPSTPSGYDSQRTSLSEQHRRSQSERELSLSVSPKTRLPSQPRGDIPHTQQQQPEHNPSAKRKMDDREMSAEEPRRPHPDHRPSSNGSNRVPSAVTSSPQQPPRKRTRYTEPPIWAQSVKGRKRSIFVGDKRTQSKPNGSQPVVNYPVQTPQVKQEMNGHRQPNPSVIPIDDPSRILGPWEKSISGAKPSEEVTKVVADWLFMNVVNRPDLRELSSRGVEVEVEAKLGHLIDKSTNDRLRLPVMTECVLADNGSTFFKSSMTEGQHSALNQFLNQKVVETHPDRPEAKARNRVPIKYEHRRETDKFYELRPNDVAALPPAVASQLNSRHAHKVRATYDQKTKLLKAKIIKVRIADIDIYSPSTPLDCRISVNLEMKWDGDIEELKAVASTQSPDRNKDRLSYSQSHYQIDLTQVTQTIMLNGVERPGKEHELEIELAPAALRDQGMRAKNGEPNEYLSLVEGFIDNMRVLSRALAQGR